MVKDDTPPVKIIKGLIQPIVTHESFQQLGKREKEEIIKKFIANLEGSVKKKIATYMNNMKTPSPSQLMSCSSLKTPRLCAVGGRRRRKTRRKKHKKRKKTYRKRKRKKSRRKKRRRRKTRRKKGGSHAGTPPPQVTQQMPVETPAEIPVDDFLLENLNFTDNSVLMNYDTVVNSNTTGHWSNSDIEEKNTENNPYYQPGGPPFADAAIPHIIAAAEAHNPGIVDHLEQVLLAALDANAATSNANN